ncbi:uncharacterized protein ATNIH1004_005590 [Aspergillus tanneri]|uniref:Uncharacterized protein n=1 Tax=Aspergillus tanneri TaxID=1220188 RepID=A0A5M9MIS5_9EURO|nr:uncharacterized protein ATNIH1004_005590 [Aspergillus tanneri]KAA8646915.1 hypothetical protein ATNIH1004_005590 [Aspergillus tanneri]
MSYAEAASRGPKQSPDEALVVTRPTFLLHLIYKDESESTASLVDVDSPHVTAVDPNYLNQEIKTTTQAERIQREEEEEKKQEARAENKAKAKAKASSVRDNASNPVYIGNAVIVGVIGAGLGLGAYRKHVEGQLSWQLIGVWTGAIGALGVADYFVSK